MFDNLTDRLSRTLRNISGRGRLTEDNIKDTLREVRMALLEADVALPVVRDFISRVKESAVGHEVNKSLTPGQEFVKIVRNELVAAMGEENQTLDLAARRLNSWRPWPSRSASTSSRPTSGRSRLISSTRR